MLSDTVKVVAKIMWRVFVLIFILSLLLAGTGCDLRGGCEHLDCEVTGTVQSGLEQAIEAGEAAVEGAQRAGERACQWDMIECPAEYED